MSSKNATVANSHAAELRAKLARLIERHAPANGESSCAVPDLLLTSRTVANGCQAAFEPSLMVFAQGKKDVRLGIQTYHCDSESFLLSSVELPLGGLVVEATKKTPLLLLRLKLNMELVREVLASKSVPELAASLRGVAIVKGETPPELLDACIRLLELLDAPKDIPFLSLHVQREILYRLLSLPQGNILRSIATADDTSSRIAKAVTWVKRHFAEPMQMEELAATAGVSQSTLNSRFRSLTGMSPLQYQKQLRLLAAQDRMVIEGADASTAAFNVGYESVSQFTREYRKVFGMPPMADVRQRRRQVATHSLSPAQTFKKDMEERNS